MVVDTTLYDLLGVAPDVSAKDLERAYKKKARELHPDKNRDDPDATSKFQTMKEAYEILKDEEQRAIYDKYGPKGLEESMQGGTGFDDILSNLFGFGGAARQKTRTIYETLEVTLEEMYNGAEKEVEIERHTVCQTCQGKGTKEGAGGQTCKTCNGEGEVIMRQMGFSTVVPCPQCQGMGEVIRASDKCKTCKGERLMPEKKILNVHVERGAGNGDRVVFAGASDEIPDVETGDAVVVIKQAEHPVFERHNDDLLIHKKISLYEALYGANFVIEHLDGRKLVIESDGSVISPDTVKIIKNEGMPQKGNPFQRGLLYIQFDIVFPTKEQLSEGLMNELKKVSPEMNSTADIDLNADDVFTVEMEDGDIENYNNSKKSKGEKRHEAYRSDDDDMYMGYDEDDYEEDGEGGQACQPM